MFLKQLSSILSHKEILSIFKNLYIEKTSGIFGHYFSLDN